MAEILSVGGRATSGLQGEYGQVGSAPDWLGGLDLSASRCQHSGQSGVFVLMCLLCVVVGRGIQERTDRRDPRRAEITEGDDSGRTLVIVFVFGFQRQ